MNRPENLFWEFGPFQLDSRKHLLFRDSQLVPLSPKAADILALLVEKNGSLVEKEELMRSIWPDTFVEESNLAVHISQLRKVLSEGSETNYIETIPRRGYRFIGEVKTAIPDLAAPTAGPVRDSDEASRQVRSADSAAAVSVPGSQVPASRSGLWVGLAVLVVALAAFGLWERGRVGSAAIAPTTPVAASGALSEKDNVMLADIANNTGEPEFNSTLRQAMAIELEQSPYLSLVPETRMQESLRMMGKPANAQLSPDLSRELCQRTGSAAVLDGWIARMGTEYTVDVRAVNCRSGDHLADLQVTAASKNLVLKALSDATSQLRVKLGESLATVQKFDTPIEEATTPSLEALQAYSIGRETMVQKDESASGVPFFEKAIRLDPDFAMAYAALGNAFSNLGEDGKAAESFTRAYLLRQHVSEREKFYIESHYFQFVTGNLDKAEQSYEHWADTYPRDIAPETNLAAIYSDLGKFDQSLARAKIAVALAPDNAQNYANLVDGYIGLNQIDEAWATAQDALARKLDSSVLRLYMHDIAFMKRDAAAGKQQMDWAAGEPGVEDVFLGSEANSLAFYGHVVKANEMSERAAASALKAGEKETAAAHEIEIAQRAALYGYPAEARRHAERALSLASDHDTEYGAAVALALSGDTQRPQAIADALAKRYPEDTVVQYCYLPAIRAAIALREHDPERATKALEAIRLYELGFSGNLLGVYLRGLSLLDAKDGSSAAAEFQKVLDHPGVVSNAPIGALAHLQLARAYALAGDAAQAKSSYSDFVTLWKDADPDLPILKQAQAERAKLQ